MSTLTAVVLLATLVAAEGPQKTNAERTPTQVPAVAWDISLERHFWDFCEKNSPGEVIQQMQLLRSQIAEAGRKAQAIRIQNSIAMYDRYGQWISTLFPDTLGAENTTIAQTCFPRLNVFLNGVSTALRKTPLTKADLDSANLRLYLERWKSCQRSVYEKDLGFVTRRVFRCFDRMIENLGAMAQSQELQNPPIPPAETSSSGRAEEAMAQMQNDSSTKGPARRSSGGSALPAPKERAESPNRN
jgi:hypothetical protein